MSKLLETKQLTMRFGGLTAVDELSMVVEPGQIVSLIGPNGAGKTTAFNAITGVYAPTAGQVLLDQREAIRPLTTRVWLGCLLIGLGSAIAGLLIGGNINSLWNAVINQPHDRDEFQWSALPNHLLSTLTGTGYSVLQNRLTKEWQVVTLDVNPADSNKGKKLGRAKNRADAQDLLQEYNTQDNQFDADRWTTVLTDKRWQGLLDLAELQQQLSMVRARHWQQWGGALFGLLLGSWGAWSIWKRGRRSPEVVNQSGMARTFQNIRLFKSMTVRENVLVGLDRQIRGNILGMFFRTPGQRKTEKRAAAQAEQVLDFVGLAAKSGKLAGDLPYGDQRRLEIARALATQPRLLLLDEPGAGMNPNETADLIELIRLIRQRGTTVLLIEHHMNVVMGISDQIVVLDYGEQIAAGPPAEIRNNRRVIEAYLGAEETV